MELVDGETLADRIRGGAIPASEALTWAKQICEARFWAAKQGRQPTERGILVTHFFYIRSLDARTVLQTGLTRDGTFLVDNGKITRSLKNFRWNESPLLILNRFEDIGRPVATTTTSCTITSRLTSVCFLGVVRCDSRFAPGPRYDAPTMALSPGMRLGPYEIVAPLGAGGMGEVYRARDTRLQRDVALKVLPPSLVADPARRARFVREAQAASALEHPHIAVIHEIGEADQITFIVMELVRGEPLSDIIGRGPLTVSRATDLAIEVAEGLARAHETGLVHRDLKPANVMVTADGHAKIIDFGLAKLVVALSGDSNAATVPGHATEPGAVVGTAAYMSPEQVRGEPVDHRTDIFSLGVVIYEMLTGRRPFTGRSGIETMHAILHEPAAPLALDGAMTGDLPRIVAKCLTKDSAERYQSMRDVVVDLRTVRRQLESGQVHHADTRRRSGSRLTPGMLTASAIALAIVVAVGWMYVRRARDEAERTATVAEVERLVDLGQFVDVWRAVRPALQRWPDEPHLDAMMRSTTMSVTLTTDPPGADVALKALGDVGGAWVPVGQTPLKEVRAPLGMLRWRITRAGYDPLEARLEVGTPAAAAGRPDVDAPPIRLRPLDGDFPGMVFVRGGVAGGISLTDYWLDRTEVTNRDFKAFIDRGGYEDQRYWANLSDGLETGAARFRDRTGRPGPATWELGTYANGRDDFPVTGVSWFEAVAFCRAAGKSLPTIWHWRNAFGATFFMEAVTLGNFAGRGPEPVTQLNDLGPWGTSGMAGNVKEWVWNEAEGQRYILGGAWNEPAYMATDPDVRPPFERAETNGFRCVSETNPSQPAAYGELARSTGRDYTKETPADDATFEIYRQFYAYDHTPLDPKTERIEEFGEWRRERVSFAAAYDGERVLANILIPKNASPPYQSVIWFPGSYATGLRRSDGDLPFSYYFDFLPKSGRALVYPVYKGTYERPTKIPGALARRDTIVQWSKDLGRTLDYLGSRSDFDSAKIGYYGFSMGAGVAVPAVALEPRLKTVILLAGGLYVTIPIPAEADPFNFVPRITAPVLFLTGRYDFGLPVETSQRPLFNLLGTPPEHKKHVIFENAGHVPPRLDVIREVLEWLDRYLGPVAHPAGVSTDR